MTIFEQYGIEAVTGAEVILWQAIQSYLSGQLESTQPCTSSERHHHHGA